MNKTTAAVLVGAAIGLAAAAFVSYDSQPEGGMYANDPDLVRQGSHIYSQYCADCHGANLEGQPNWREQKENGALPAPPHDETGHTWHHDEQHLFKVTKFGVAPFAPEGWVTEMPGFEGQLSDEQIWAVLSYIKSKWPPQAVAHQEKVSQR